MYDFFWILVPIFLVFAIGALTLNYFIFHSTGPANGVPALGIVQSLKLANTGSESAPYWKIEFEVHYADGAVGYATVRRGMKDIDPNMFEVGSEIALNVHPKNRHQVYLADAAKQLELNAIQDDQRLKNGLVSADDLEIAKTGSPARAVIKELEPTGVIHRGEAQFNVALMAQIEHESVENPYGTTPAQELRRTVFLPEQISGEWHVGKIVDIRHHPDDWQKFVICLPPHRGAN